MKIGQILIWMTLVGFGFYLGTSFTIPQTELAQETQDQSPEILPTSASDDLSISNASVVSSTSPNSSTGSPAPNNYKRKVDPVTIVTDVEKRTIDLFESSAPSVAFITTTGLQKDYYSRNIYEIPKGSGTGFLWDEEGHIVTNYHVIKDGQKWEVTLGDQSIWPAEVIGFEARKDIAILKINAPREKLRPIPVGSSHDLRVGQSVFAIGNPFGLDQTLTTGVISALGREIESLARIPIRDVIQTDAAINPGNSRGPLLDSSGRLIGVNTAIYSPSGASAGIGFSIPVDIVNWVVPDIIQYGEVQRPMLGVELVPPQFTERWGIKGAMIAGLASDGIAAQSGLQDTQTSQEGSIRRYGDIIIGINEDVIKTNNDLILALEKYKPGAKVKVSYIRDEKEYQMDITLGSSL